MKLRQITVAAILAPVVFACGEPTDDPEDCAANQYFDETRKLCITCLAATEPTCEPGCGFVIEPDANGCPQAACLDAASCDLCEPTQYFDDDQARCVDCAGPATCADGNPTRTIADGTCYLDCPDGA